MRVLQGGLLTNRSGRHEWTVQESCELARSGSGRAEAHSDVTRERDEVALERAVNVREPLRFATSARLIASLDGQPRRVERQGDNLLVDWEIALTDAGYLALVTAVHELLPFAWLRNARCADALPVASRRQVEDHPGIVTVDDSAGQSDRSGGPRNSYPAFAISATLSAICSSVRRFWRIAGSYRWFVRRQRRLAVDTGPPPGM